MQRFQLYFLAGLLLLACGLPSAVASPLPEPTASEAPAGTAVPTVPATGQPSSTPAEATESPAVDNPPEHPIQIRMSASGAEFYDTRTRATFIPRGVNYFWIVPSGSGFQDRIFQVGGFDPDRISADFATLAKHGYNTVRIFLDSCSDAPGCAGNPTGPGLNPDYLDNIAHTMLLAREAGIFLLLTSNDLPSQVGYWRLVDDATNEQFGPYRNAHYLTGPGVEAGRRYWTDLMSGLDERQAPFEVVLGWSLLNEQWYFYTDPPFNLTSGHVTTANGKTYDLADPAQHQAMAVDGMRHYIAALRQVILGYDPTALITMGFFVPDYPEPIRQDDFRYVETAPLLAEADLDFFDFHAYPGEEPLSQLAINFGMIDYLDKPIILGETGAFVDRYASSDSAVQSMQIWLAQSCQVGFDGFLYWGLYRAPEAIGDASWSLLDDGGRLLEALSSTVLPDPCDPARLPPENLALNKPVRVSNALPLEPGEHAVDGQPTQWGAGQDATQWIEIDLGQPTILTRILLVVAQFPAGDTVHQIWGRGPDESLRLLHEFRGSTDQGDGLEFVPEDQETVQFIRIVTVQSPSWVAWQEIEVYGQPAEEFP
jgi:hypothetical protein